MSPCRDLKAINKYYWHSYINYATPKVEFMFLCIAFEGLTKHFSPYACIHKQPPTQVINIFNRYFLLPFNPSKQRSYCYFDCICIFFHLIYGGKQILKRRLSSF